MVTRRERRNVGASVRARLMSRSRNTGENFQFLLQRYAAERFLYRLGESQHRERYVLKGAMLLALWDEAVYRSTPITQHCSTSLVRKSVFTRAKPSWPRSSMRWL